MIALGRLVQMGMRLPDPNHGSRLRALGPPHPATAMACAQPPVRRSRRLPWHQPDPMRRQSGDIPHAGHKQMAFHAEVRRTFDQLWRFRPRLIHGIAIGNGHLGAFLDIHDERHRNPRRIWPGAAGARRPSTLSGLVCLCPSCPGSDRNSLTAFLLKKSTYSPDCTIQELFLARSLAYLPII